MKSYFFVSCIFLLGACGTNSKKEDKTIVSSIAAEQYTDEELKKIQQEILLEEERKIKEEIDNQTNLAFEDTIHDFGKVKPNSKNSYSFKILNTGKKPLIIKNTSASCGCTTPSKPEAPILPSKHDFIKVVFEPKPSQKGTIEKSVSVEANTSQKLHVIKIKAFVE
jgi:hypothetical protein